jgi:hypothetical protein
VGCGGRAVGEGATKLYSAVNLDYPTVSNNILKVNTLLHPGWAPGHSGSGWNLNQLVIGIIQNVTKNYASEGAGV